MTAREIMDNLSETLLRDERILSVQERELLANLLQRTTTQVSTRENAVAETIARAVGETIAQRAYGLLGNSIAERLLASSAGNGDTNAIVAQHDPSPPKATQATRRPISAQGAQATRRPISAQGAQATR